MTCTNVEISGDAATLVLSDAVDEQGYPLQLVDYGLMTKDGRLVTQPNPLWYTVASGTGNAVDQGGGTLFHYHLPITVTIDPVSTAFPEGDLDALYRGYYIVQRKDCSGVQYRCEHVFNRAMTCQVAQIITETWIVFTGNRSVPPGSTTFDVDGIHAFAISDPAGTFLTLFPFGSTLPGQRFTTDRVEVFTDPAGLAWLYYVTRPVNHVNNVNIRRVRLNGQTDTELLEPEVSQGANILAVYYDSISELNLFIWRNNSNQIRKMFSDGSGGATLQTGINALDLAISADGVYYYYIVGTTVRRAQISGGPFDQETGNINAEKIMVTDSNVFVRRRDASENVFIEQYDLDLSNPVAITTPVSPATAADADMYGVELATLQHFFHRKWTSGADGISRYAANGTVITEEFYQVGDGTLGGPRYGFAINTVDQPLPVSSRVSKLYLTASGDVDDIIKAEADATTQVVIDTDPSRTATARAIAYHQAEDLVYFASESNDTIYQEGNDGSGPVAWLTAQDQVFGLWINETTGYLYFSMKGEGGKIKRAPLGGATASSVEEIVTGIGTGIRHLSGDADAGKIYWADQTAGLIRRADDQGLNQNVETVATLANAYTVCVEPGLAGTFFYFASTGATIRRRVKNLLLDDEEVFVLTNHASAVNPRQMTIDPNGLWIYFVTASRVWRFLHSMSGLNGSTGLTVLNGAANPSYEGIALQLV